MYIYVLHFTTKLHHAGHYTGSTTNLLERLRDHAAGRGSRLCQVLKQRHVEWTLGTLYYTKDRRAESKLKKIYKNGSRCCNICTNDTPHIPEDCIELPIHDLKHPITSQELREHGLHR